MQQNVKSTQTVVELSLDAARNRILKLNMQIGMMSVAFASGSLIAAIFGMNLRNHFEIHPQAFAYTSGGIVLCAGLIYVTYTLYYLHTKKTVHQLTVGVNSNPFFENLGSPQFVHQLVEIPRDELIKVLETATGKRFDAGELNGVMMFLDQKRDKQRQDPRSDTHDQVPHGVYPMPRWMDKVMM
jgi:hypothetical protein